MSIGLMSLVWKVSLPASEKLVLLALADCANDEGGCWPSMKTLVGKCSKSERTVQAAIKALVDAGHLTRTERLGKGCFYTVHPRESCTPAKVAPPQKTTKTPAESADKPSRTIIPDKSKALSGARAKKQPEFPIPAEWQPKPFGAGTICRGIVDGWPPGELAFQAEKFAAHHSKTQARWSDWQAAWKTWVLNSREFRNRTQGNGQSANNGNQSGGRTVAAASNVLERIREAGMAGSGGQGYADHARNGNPAVDALPSPLRAIGHDRSGPH